MQQVDKPLLLLKNKPLIAHVIKLAEEQIDDLVISVNRNLEFYSDFHLPLIPDLSKQSMGPLAGIYSAMQWYRNTPAPPQYLACFPADVPLFPKNLVAALEAQLQRTNADIAWCRQAEQLQPLFSLWNLESYLEIESAIEHGMYSPKFFIESQRNTLIEVKSNNPGDFFNINTPEELLQAERYFE